MIGLIIVLVIALVVTLVYFIFMSPYSNVFWKIPYKAKTKEKIIALTFDDGPNDKHTKDLLDFLKKHDIKVTFFLVGKAVVREPQIVKRIYKDGHTIGNHSYNHKFLNYFKEPTYMSEIIDTQNAIKNVIGRNPNLFRSPWLWRQPSLVRTVRGLKLNHISGVFCHSLEVFQPLPTRIAKGAISKAKPGSIIIFHDGQDGDIGYRGATVEAVKITIKTLLKQGYKFTTVDELLKIPAYK